jgi:hypothetical protein
MTDDCDSLSGARAAICNGREDMTAVRIDSGRERACLGRERACLGRERLAMGTGRAPKSVPRSSMDADGGSFTGASTAKSREGDSMTDDRDSFSLPRPQPTSGCGPEDPRRCEGS